jgi:hypothetical protein
VVVAAAVHEVVAIGMAIATHAVAAAVATFVVGDVANVYVVAVVDGIDGVVAAATTGGAMRRSRREGRGGERHWRGACPLGRRGHAQEQEGGTRRGEALERVMSGGKVCEAGSGGSRVELTPTLIAGGDSGVESEPCLEDFFFFFFILVEGWRS